MSDLSSKADELAKLADLRDRGVLTEAEFQRQKNEVLKSDALFVRATAKLANRVRAAIVGGVGIAVLLVVAVVVALVPSSSNSRPQQVQVAEASASASQVQAAINWGMSHNGQNYDAYLCLKFVYDAWAAAGVDIGGRFSSDTAALYWQDNPKGFVKVASPNIFNDPPAGALVFWAGAKWNGYAGHVALSLGNNRVVSTLTFGVYTVHTFTLDQSSYIHRDYAGYIMPLQSKASPPAQNPAPSGGALALGQPAGPSPQGGSVSVQPAGGSNLQPAAPAQVLQPTANPSQHVVIAPSASPPANSSPPPTPAPTTPPQTSPPPTSPPATPAPQPPPPPPATYSETTGGVTHTWTNYSNAGGTEGQSIPAYTTVQIACKVQGFKVADGNTWWYRIAQSPWNGQFYASADAFYNNGATSGSLQGTPFVDNNVPNC